MGRKGWSRLVAAVLGVIAVTSGCVLGKPSKNSHNETADRMRARRDWTRLEERAWGP